MQSRASNNLGLVAAVLLAVSLIFLALGERLFSPSIVPNIWLAACLGTLPASLILAALAAWRGVRWWFLIAVISLLSEAFCLMSVAV